MRSFWPTIFLQRTSAAIGGGNFRFNRVRLGENKSDRTKSEGTQGLSIIVPVLGIVCERSSKPIASSPREIAAVGAHFRPAHVRQHGFIILCSVERRPSTSIFWETFSRSSSQRSKPPPRGGGGERYVGLKHSDKRSTSSAVCCEK